MHAIGIVRSGSCNTHEGSAILWQVANSLTLPAFISSQTGGSSLKLMRAVIPSLLFGLWQFQAFLAFFYSSYTLSSFFIGFLSVFCLCICCPFSSVCCSIVSTKNNQLIQNRYLSFPIVDRNQHCHRHLPLRAHWLQCHHTPPKAHQAGDPVREMAVRHPCPLVHCDCSVFGV